MNNRLGYGSSVWGIQGNSNRMGQQFLARWGFNENRGIFDYANGVLSLVNTYGDQYKDKESWSDPLELSQGKGARAYFFEKKNKDERKDFLKDLLANSPDSYDNMATVEYPQDAWATYSKNRQYIKDFVYGKKEEEPAEPAPAPKQQEPELGDEYKGETLITGINAAQGSDLTEAEKLLRAKAKTV